MSVPPPLMTPSNPLMGPNPQFPSTLPPSLPTTTVNPLLTPGTSDSFAMSQPGLFSSSSLLGGGLPGASTSLLGGGGISSLMPVLQLLVQLLLSLRQQPPAPATPPPTAAAKPLDPRDAKIAELEKKITDLENKKTDNNNNNNNKNNNNTNTNNNTNNDNNNTADRQYSASELISKVEDLYVGAIPGTTDKTKDGLIGKLDLEYALGKTSGKLHDQIQEALNNLSKIGTTGTEFNVFDANLLNKFYKNNP